MTLPSFGRLPGGSSSTSPRSLVTSRIEATMASASPAGRSLASHFKVMRSFPASPSTIRRARRTSGWRRVTSFTCARPHDLEDPRFLEDHAFVYGAIGHQRFVSDEPEIGARVALRDAHAALL